MLKNKTGTADAHGVVIQLRDRIGNPILINRISRLIQQNGILELSAELVKVGAITPGNIDAMATLHVIYQ